MPQPEPNGDIIWHGFMTDITEQKQMEAERSLAEAQLKQSQKMEALGTLAGGIAHDFNNILGIIFGYSELAQAEVDDPARLQEDLGHVIQGASRAKDLVKQILTFSRQSDYEKKPVQIGLIVKEVLKMLRASLPSTIEIDHEVASEGRGDGRPHADTSSADESLHQCRPCHVGRVRSLDGSLDK